MEETSKELTTSIIKEFLNKLKKRLLMYILVTLLLGLLLFGFIVYWLNTEFNVEQTQESLKEIRSEAREKNIYERTLMIVSNNYKISILFVPPAIGWIIFTIVWSNTGKAFASDIISMQKTNMTISEMEIAFLFVIYILFFSGFGFLELLGYALTISQGFYLIKYAIISIRERKLEKFMGEIYYTVFIILVAGLILLLAAFLEALLIQMQ